jgi:hypothetical protein
MDPRSSRLDRRTIMLLSACVALASGGTVLGDAAASAVFLRRVGSTELPAVLALSALFSAGLGLVWVRLVASYPLMRAGGVAMGGIPPLLTGLALAVHLDAPYAPWGLSIVAHALSTLEPVILWGIAGALADVRDAKSLFPRLAGASIGGTAVGGGLTIVLARVGSDGLLLTWALLAIAAWALLRVVLRHARLEPEEEEPDAGAHGDGGTALQGFLLWMCTAAVLLGGLAVVIDYVYSRAVEARFRTEEDTAAFVGVMDGVVTLVSLAISTLVTPPLVRRRGVIAGIVGQPLVQILGLALLALLPGFAVVTALSVVHRSWLGGATAPAYNAALFVVPPAGRERLRTVLELVCIPGGAVLAGLALAVGAEHTSARSQDVCAMVAAGLTIAALVAARRAYRRAWEEALRRGLSHLFVPGGQAALVAFDWSAEQHLAARVGLSSGDETTRQVSASFLADDPHVDDRDALLEALDDPSTRVRAGAVRALGNLMDPAVRARLERLLRSPDPELLVAVLEVLEREPGELGPEVVGLLSHADPEVACGAARALLARAPDAAAQRTLLDLAARPAEAASGALEAITRYPFAEAGDVVRSGLADVRTREVSCRALAAVDPDGAPPVLIALLSASTPHLHAVIAGCLSRLGPRAGALLLQNAEDPVAGGPALLALALHPGAVPAPPLRRLARDRHARFGALVTAGDVLRSAAQQGSAPLRILLASVVEETQALAIEIVAGACAGAEGSAVADVLEALRGHERDLWAQALEVAEGLGDQALLRPVLAWSDDERSPGRLPELADTLSVLRNDPSPWLQELAGACDPLEPSMKTNATLSVLERVVALQKIPLFRDLSIADLRVLAGLLSEELFADGEVIGVQGERGDRMHFVHSGEVAVFIEATGERGRRQIAVSRPGEHVGEMSLLDDSPRMATMVAVGSTRTLAMTRAHFRRLATERPTILLPMLGVLAERLREARRMGSALD